MALEKIASTISMPGQLTGSGLHNNKFAERWVAWIRDITGLRQDTMAAAASAAAIAAFLFATSITWQRFSSSGKRTPFEGIPTPKGSRPFVGMR